LRVPVNEPLDEPRTRYSIDLDVLSRNPFHDLAPRLTPLPAPSR